MLSMPKFSNILRRAEYTEYTLYSILLCPPPHPLQVVCGVPKFLRCLIAIINAIV